MEVCTIDWLPTPEVIMARSKAAAVADVLLSVDPDLRQYHCDSTRPEGVTAAWRHDGMGSYYYVLQSGNSMAIKVCASHSSMGPDELARFQRNPTAPLSPLAIKLLNDPEFRYQEMSFMAWTEDGQPWQSLLFRVDGKTSPEMGQPLLDLICVGPKSFYLYGMSYHEVTLDPPALKALFNLTPLDEKLAITICPEANLRKSRKEIEVVGYPLA